MSAINNFFFKTKLKPCRNQKYISLYKIKRKKQVESMDSSFDETRNKKPCHQITIFIQIHMKNNK